MYSIYDKEKLDKLEISKCNIPKGETISGNIVEPDSVCYKRLDYVKSILNLMLAPEDVIVKVEECWLDYGAQMAWTTLIAYKDKRADGGVTSSYQMLYPVQWQKIMTAGTTAGLDEVISELYATAVRLLGISQDKSVQSKSIIA